MTNAPHSRWINQVSDVVTTPAVGDRPAQPGHLRRGEVRVEDEPGPLRPPSSRAAGQFADQRLGAPVLPDDRGRQRRPVAGSQASTVSPWLARATACTGRPAASTACRPAVEHRVEQVLRAHLDRAARRRTPAGRARLGAGEHPVDRRRRPPPWCRTCPGRSRARSARMGSSSPVRPPDHGSVRAVTVRWRLGLASALMLALELALIRWLGANIVHLSYFSNFVLLGSFLGIGLGFLRAGRSGAAARPTPLYSLVALLGLVGFVSAYPVTINRDSSQLIFFSTVSTSGPALWLILPAVFLAVATVMAGPGEIVGCVLRATATAGGLPPGPAGQPGGHRDVHRALVPRRAAAGVVRHHRRAVHRPARPARPPRSA